VGRRRGKKKMTGLLVIPIVGVIWLYINPSKKVALGISLIVLMETIRMQMGMNRESGDYQYVVRVGIGAEQEVGFGMDGISINYVMLTAILIPICIMVS
jgi:NADH-quinone oxidoreductase subunit M